MKRLLLLAFTWLLLTPLGDTAEAQVAVAELAGPGRRAESVRQRLAARLQQAGLEVVPTRSVQGDDAEAIASATGAKAIVTGRLRRRGGRWRAEVQVRDASGAVQGEARGSHRGIGGLAAQLARRIEGDVRALMAGGTEPAAASDGAGKLVVGDFSGRGAARIRNQLVRSLAGEYELAARDDLAAAAAREGGDLGDPEALRGAAAALGVRAFIDGRVSRAGRRWVLRVTVTDAATNNQISRETFRGRTSGRLAQAVRRRGASQLAGAIGQTSVPETEPEMSDVPDIDDAGGDDDDGVGADGGSGNDDEIPEPPRDRGDRPTALDIGVYGRVFHRELEYNDDHYGLLRGYTLQLGPAIELAGRWYPGAHFTSGFGAHIGIELSYERAFAIDSVPADPDDDRVFPTRSQEWLLGLRGRIPFGRHAFSMGLGYGSHFFVIEPSGPAVEGRGNLPEIPRTEYDFLRIHGEARLHVASGFHVTVGGGYRVVFSAGGIEDEVWFPKASVGGVEADVVLGYQLESGLVIRLGFDWRRYFYSMNVDLTSPWIVGGAVDQYLGGSLGIAYRY